MNVLHPLGLNPPEEWWTEQNGNVSIAQYNEWLAAKEPLQKRGKYGQIAGYFEDLGLSLKSLLEARTMRYLVFVGHVIWRQKGVTPPAEGKWVCYEWCDYKLPVLKGKAKDTVISYLPDFFAWSDGALTIYEAKGMMNARSKQRLNLWPVHHPDIRLEVITAPIIVDLAQEALYAARRRGEKAIEIPNWDQKPTTKKGTSKRGALSV